MALAADTYPAAATAGSSDAADLLSARDQRTTRPVAAAANPSAADATAGHLAAAGSGDATDLLPAWNFRASWAVAEPANLCAASAAAYCGASDCVAAGQPQSSATWRAAAAGISHRWRGL